MEATRKKSDFQRDAVEALGLGNVEVVNARSEELAHDAVWRGAFDAGLCRALASLAVGIELVMPFVRVGGLGLFWKGPGVEEEMDEAVAACSALGAHVEKPVGYCLPGVSHGRFFLASVRKTEETPAKYPRKASQYKRRPYRP